VSEEDKRTDKWCQCSVVFGRFRASSACVAAASRALST
jgi:hypothetical protein